MVFNINNPPPHSSLKNYYILQYKALKQKNCDFIFILLTEMKFFDVKFYLNSKSGCVSETRDQEFCKHKNIYPKKY